MTPVNLSRQLVTKSFGHLVIWSVSVGGGQQVALWAYMWQVVLRSLSENGVFNIKAEAVSPVPSRGEEEEEEDEEEEEVSKMYGNLPVLRSVINKHLWKMLRLRNNDALKGPSG